MTADERTALEALNRCRLLPGSWNKRFIRNLVAAPSERPLSLKQQATLWKLVQHYRRQLPPEVEYLGEEKNARLVKEKLAYETEGNTFEIQLTDNPGDYAVRMVYSDWLEENGQERYAQAQRWIVEKDLCPVFKPAGQAYAVSGIYPINFEWKWDWEFRKGPWDYSLWHSVGTWHRTRCRAEQALGLALAGNKHAWRAAAEATAPIMK